ncbi:hypothetical protein [Nocardioides sp. Kera G14]|uniref:hypothetical protein n=1 Tax=Nocardioides sp. Kera G14 TaxID=2884264 RepID=UPI001D11CD7A|nr:hypothetical protein [Nocardioides sp. Kera G14]UDY22336.1 hypothetical protein LH076_09605 [Nocardioides sp. Kera G14]
MSAESGPRTQLVSSRQRRLEGALAPHLDGSLARIRRGYYRPVDPTIESGELYRLRIDATVEARREEMVLSHVTAAHLWGCPLLRADLALVHATRPGKARRTAAGVQVHRAAIPDEHVVIHASGLLVTSPGWTAVQVASTLGLPNALLPLDHLVRLLNGPDADDPAAGEVVEDLIELISPRMKGHARAERLLRLADARSGSAGESLSRGQMELLGVPRPQLQVAFPRGDQPGDDIVDFDWPDLGVFGEFDGKGKYFREEFTAGRSPEEVLWDEKVREDRIRRIRPRAVRWDWATALSRDRLARVLAGAGVLPPARRAA